jgi:hypothetical protein
MSQKLGIRFSLDQQFSAFAENSIFNEKKTTNFTKTPVFSN